MEYLYEYIALAIFVIMLCLCFVLPEIMILIRNWTNKYFHKIGPAEQGMIDMGFEQREPERVEEYFETERQIMEIISKTIEPTDDAERGLIKMGFELCEKDDPHAAMRFENGLTIKRIDPAEQESEYKKNYIPREDWEREDCADCLYPERDCDGCINKASKPEGEYKKITNMKKTRANRRRAKTKRRTKSARTKKTR